MGHLPTEKFTKVAKEKLIPNFPIGPQDIRNAEHIFGPDTECLMGQTTQKRSPVNDKVQVAGVPQEILEQHCKVTTAMDVMKVNGISFLVTILRNIKFGMVSLLQRRTKSNLIKGMEAVNTLSKLGA